MAKKEMGLKLALEGEKKFKENLAEMNRGFRVLGSEMKLVTSQFDKNDKSVEALTARNGALNKQIDFQKDKIEELKKALAHSAEAFGENDKRTQEWQVKLNNAQAALNKMEREVESNNKAISEMENAEESAAKDTDKLGRELRQTGNEADASGKKLEKLKNVASGLGKAFVAMGAAIGAAAVAAGKKMWDMSQDVAEAGDEIDKNSQKIGISAEAYQNWDYVFKRCGADVDNLQGGMKKLSGVIVEAANGSDKAAEKLKAVGLSVEDLNGKSQDEQLSIVIGALQKMESGAQRTAAANALFGKSATDMAAVLNLTAEETEKLKKEAQDYGMVMSDEAVKASAAFKDSLTKLDGTINGLKNRMIGELLPGINEIIDGFSDFVAGKDGADEKITDGVEKTILKINDMIPQALTLIKSLGTAILNAAPVIVKSLGEGIIKALPELVKMLPELIKQTMGIINSIYSALIDALPELLPAVVDGIVELIRSLVDNIDVLLDAAIEIVSALIDGLIDALPELIPAVLEGAMKLVTAIAEALPELITKIVEKLPELVDTIINALVDTIPNLITALLLALPKIIDGLMTLVLAIVDALPKIITSLLSALPKVIGSIIDALIECLPQLIDGAITLVLALVEHLPEIIFGIIKAIPQILVSVAEALVKAAPKLIHGAITLVAKLVEKIPEIIGKLLAKMPEVIKNIADCLLGGLGEIVNVGKNLIFGLWDGISQSWSWLWDKISGFLGGLWDAIKGFFGIHSPSAKARDILGKNLIRGFADGIIDEGKTAVKAMQSVADDVFGVGIKTPKLDAKSLQAAFDGATADLSGRIDISGGASARQAPVYNVQFKFGSVTINDGTDIEKFADKLSGYLYEDIINKGGAFA